VKEKKRKRRSENRPKSVPEDISHVKEKKIEKERT